MVLSITLNKYKQMKQDAFDKMMGYSMEYVKQLAKQVKYINRNSIVKLNLNSYDKKKNPKS